MNEYIDDGKEYSPDREHDQDIVITVVEILVHDDGEEKESVEHNHQGGHRGVATDPGPGQVQPGVSFW